MSKIVSLKTMIQTHIHSGAHVALEGFTHLIPHAAGHEIIRQGINHLTLYRMTPDIIYDQLIGMGLARKLVFSWGGNPGVGSLHRLRDTIERAWPHPLDIDERSHADMATAYTAGASGLPFGILKGYAGSDIPAYNPHLKTLVCPFSGENLTAVKAINPDVTIIHAQQADKQGNICWWGISGVQKEAALAAQKCLVTVEEIVDKLQPQSQQAVVLPHWVITAIAEVPGGAHPSYAQGYSVRDNAFYQHWDLISRDRARFQDWIKSHILDTLDFAEFQNQWQASAS